MQLSVCCAGGCMSEEGISEDTRQWGAKCFLTWNTNHTAWRLCLALMEEQPRCP